jgi:gluconate 2-dehydrogenase gamma chain
LASVALLVADSKSYGGTIAGVLPWEPNAGDPVDPVQPGPWKFFTGHEARTMEALADRVIPPDPETPGGKDSGSAVFVDRQLAGPYGAQDGLYLRPPFLKGGANQGPQSQGGPRQEYRDGLAALDRACRMKFAGKTFADLADDDKDTLLHGIEKGDIQLDGADGKLFFANVVRDVQMGFFADPIYGGNRDMVAWKMIGYPGARYNYLDWVTRHNERFSLPPVSMTGSIDWTPKNAGSQ